MHAAVKTPLPVTILTGFLGSGKTTLINHLLRSHPDERIAIVENEFGSVGIDGSLIRNQARVEVVELSNGCVCCSIRGELSQALYDIITRIDNGELPIDRLILETTGLADPGPIIQTFFVDELIRERVVLDAVITLVDAHHILKQLDEHRVASAQIGFADRIILSKTDLIEPAQKERVLQRIHQINAKAQLIAATHGALPKEVWLDINAFQLDDTLQLNSGVYQAQPSAISPQNATVSNLHLTHFTAVPTPAWEDDIQSYVFEAGELDLMKLDVFLETLVEQYGNDMLRYKGVLAIHGEPRPLIVQGVHKVVGFDYGAAFTQKRRSLLIVIARRIPYETLKQDFLKTQVSTALN